MADPERVSDDLTDTLGFEVVLTADDAEYLQQISDELLRLSSHGLLDGLALYTDSIDVFGKPEHFGDLFGSYRPSTKELYVDRDAMHKRQDQFSTDHRFGTLWHELSHHRIREENPGINFSAGPDESSWGEDTMEVYAVDQFKQFDDPTLAGPAGRRSAMSELRRVIKDEVSHYAANWSPMEFVAETFAGMMDGQTYPPIIMDLYKRLHGPSVPLGVRGPPKAAVETQRAHAQPRTFTVDDIERIIHSFDGVHDITKTEFERDDIAFEFRLGRMERPSSIVFDAIRGKVESVIFRLPPLEPEYVRNRRDDAGAKLFSVFREANRGIHALPEHLDILIAGPKGLTPHFEAGKVNEEQLPEFVDRLVAAYMSAFGEPGNLRDYPAGSGPSDFWTGGAENRVESSIDDAIHSQLRVCPVCRRPRRG